MPNDSIASVANLAERMTTGSGVVATLSVEELSARPPSLKVLAQRGGGEMGTATARRLDHSDVAAERDAILDGLGMSEAELHDRANNYLLTEDEAAAWRRLEALAWLSGERS